MVGHGDLQGTQSYLLDRESSFEDPQQAALSACLGHDMDQDRREQRSVNMTFLVIEKWQELEMLPEYPTSSSRERKTDINTTASAAIVTKHHPSAATSR